MEQISSLKERIVMNDLSVKALIQELSTCGSSEMLNSLNPEIVRCLSQQETGVEGIRRIAKDFPTDEVIKSKYEAFRAQVRANYGTVTKATINCRKLLGEKMQKELFSVRSKEESETISQLRRRRLNKENLSEKASSITEDLLCISQMMASQVSLSEQSLNTLVSSSAVVTETQEEFRMMNSLLRQSRKLLSKYSRREVTDRVSVFFALAFFFGCCLYIILKRLPTIL